MIWNAPKYLVMFLLVANIAFLAPPVSGALDCCDRTSESDPCHDSASELPCHATACACPCPTTHAVYFVVIAPGIAQSVAQSLIIDEPEYTFFVPTRSDISIFRPPIA